jgi:hypothetical protein
MLKVENKKKINFKKIKKYKKMRHKLDIKIIKIK